MKKSGFTLVELMAVIILLGILGLIAVPVVTNIINDNKESLYKSQLVLIQEQAEKWAYENLDMLPSRENEQITLTILELKKNGKLPLDLRNPKTNELFPNDMQVAITIRNNQYIFEVKADTGTSLGDEVNGLSPIMVLNGSVLEYLEMGSTYEEKNVFAKDKDGNSITNIDIQYLDNGVEVASLSSNSFKTYTVVYTAKSTVNNQEYTSHVVRTVIVRDTLAPELTIPDNITITLSEAATFNVKQGVTYQDNSNETLNIEVSGFEATLGQKKVSYKVCDSSNNCTVKNRLITITE